MKAKVKIPYTTKDSTWMPKSLRLRPSQEDVVKGQCNHPTKCMYALCLWRMFPKATYISVNPNCITITIYGFYYHYGIPLNAVKHISEYDENRPIDIRRAAVTATFVGVRACRYQPTAEAKEYYREKSARRRADPDYVRPDSKQTVRGLLAHGRSMRRQKDASPAT